jgi:L,D-transpeptidase catalytic domain
MTHGARFARVAVITGAVLIATASVPAAHRQSVGASSWGLAALRAPPAPALKIGAPVRLDSGRFLGRWTILRAGADAHTRPGPDAPVITRLGRWTSDGTPNALQVLGSRADGDGRLWVEVRLPVLPNGRVGWIRRELLGAYETVDTHLFVDREHLRLTLLRGGKIVFTAPVGIGTDEWPTPAGDYMIRDELTRYARPFYGPIAFGTTARSAVLTEWPGGGFIGIHGTNEPALLPGRVSHGCIRMRNADILRLARLMPVGTPVTIR